MIVVRRYEVKLAEKDEKAIQDNGWPSGELIDLLTRMADVGDLENVFLVKWIRRSLGRDPEIGTIEWIDGDGFDSTHHEELYGIEDYEVTEIGWEIEA